MLFLLTGCEVGLANTAEPLGVLVYRRSCVVGSADTVLCVDRLAGECTLESHGELVGRRVMR